MMTINNPPYIKLKVGDKFRDKDYLYHVVSTFEDNGETFIVFKYFGRHKRWYHYELKSQDGIDAGFFVRLYWKGRKKH